MIRTMSYFDSAADKLELTKILTRIQSYASSELGKESLRELIPSIDISAISVEHNRVSEIKRVLEGGENLPIDGIKDIRTSVNRSAIENAVLPPKELHHIAITLQTAKNLKTFIEKRRDILPEISSLTSGFTISNEIIFNINQAIDENAEIKDSASKSLRSIRQSIADKQQSIRRALEKILRATAEQGMVQDEIVTTRDGRMVIPIKAELKNRFPGFIHSTSASGQTVFIEPSETLTLNNEITELFFNEQREIDRILRDLTNLVRTNAHEIRSLVDVLKVIDSCYAKARYSIEIKGNKPLLKEIGSIVIRNGFHPVLLLRHSRESVVALDVELGTSFNTLLITGPNAGGKTVTLKSIGILVLMVQCGIHIPVSPDSEFPVFTKLFVLIGDNQSIENDLSTYSSQILKIKEILEFANKSSLVLIDEIGSNTDPNEGGAIAATVLRYLSNAGAITVATSHQAALKAFVHNEKHMENGAMEFDQETLLPTYRFKLGVPGSSYALEIAQRLGIQDSVISEAKSLVGHQQTKLEQLILDMENRSQLLEQRLSMADGELLKYKELSASYNIKLSQLNVEIKELKRKAIEEAKSIVEKAARTIEMTVKEIRTEHAHKDVIQKGKKQIAELEKEISALEKDISDSIGTEKVKPPELKVGDTIVLISGGQVGTVQTLPNKRGELTVAFNSIKAKVHASNIKSILAKHEQTTAASYSLTTDKVFSNEVDVRGLYSDEAVPLIDKFIDDAVLAGLQRLCIIHGHGTGALRKKIHTFLERDTRVKTSRFGESNEGGAGVTIIELV
ncbi:MAG: endonuclease MutS2 [Bacteroidota bacterium]